MTTKPEASVEESITALRERVEQFHMMQLPGQPMMMHMGTSYLIGDLETMVSELAEAIRAERSRPDAVVREAALEEAALCSGEPEGQAITDWDDPLVRERARIRSAIRAPRALRASRDHPSEGRSPEEAVSICDRIAGSPPANDARHPDWQMGWQDGAMECAAAIRESLSAPPHLASEPGGAWRPIESGPKDGTRFIGYYPTGSSGRRPSVIRILHRHDPGGTYESWVGDDNTPFGVEPTHWMPLPERGEGWQARLLNAAKLLYANAEGCVVNHHAVDFEEQGLPGWLDDCKADIDAAARALASPSPDIRREARDEGLASKALDIVKVLANTPPEDWLSKPEIHAELAEFRSLKTGAG